MMAAVDQLSSRMSLAVQLRDDFSGTPALAGSTRVFVTETGTTALQTPSGYHVFKDLDETIVTVRVENKFYFPAQIPVNLSMLDADRPLVTQTMKPAYLYPFPAGATLVRGIIVDGTQHPVAEAFVSVAGSTVATNSEGDGRFVLYWGPLGEDDISVVNRRAFLKIANSTTIVLHVTHPSFAAQDVTVGTIAEGQLRLLTTAIVMAP